MSNKIKSMFRWSPGKSKLIAALFLFAISSTSYAVFIDFDDIVARPSEVFDGCFCGHTLSNEYESQGVIFDDGWLFGEVLPDGTNRNHVKGFNTIQFSFLDILPTFVSFNASSVFDEAVIVDVFGAGGLLYRTFGSGWVGTEEDSTPYIPNELFTLSAAEGISSVSITAFYNLRTGPSIDNLTFDYASVPEPSMFWLMSLGLFGLIWQRRRTLKQQ